MPYKDPADRRAYNEAHAGEIREQRKRYRAANSAKTIAQSLAWAAANPERSKAIGRKALLKRNFGLTPEQHDEMIRAQDNLCAICHQPERDGRGAASQTLSIDHDHSTGVVRELLCRACNHGIGNFYENPELLLAAANYLTKWRNL